MLAYENYRYPKPIGDLVEIVSKGRKINMHVWCGGDDNARSPFVIFEHGIGGQLLDFSMQSNCNAGHVLDAMPKDVRWCAYDHAGYGWSSPGNRPRNVQVIVEEFGALAKALNWKKVVIVGHSLAGYTLKLAAELPHVNIVGAVLADPADTVTIAEWNSCKRGDTFNEGRIVE